MHGETGLTVVYRPDATTKRGFSKLVDICFVLHAKKIKIYVD